MDPHSPHARRLPLPVALVVVVAVAGGFAAEAVAQSACVTSQMSCYGGTRQRAGSPCRCVDNRAVTGSGMTGSGTAGSAMMGEVVINGDVSPNYPGYYEGERRSGGLRNDDLDDHDDVLAGPRHHPRRRPEPPARNPPAETDD